MRTGGRADQGIFHLDAAVAAGFNDCMALHIAPIRPLHRDPPLPSPVSADAHHLVRPLAARAFVERPGADTALIPCPPLGSISYPG